MAAELDQGATVGMLVAGPRRGEQAFDPRDRAVLGDIAQQAGTAVHAEALTARSARLQAAAD